MNPDTGHLVSTEGEFWRTLSKSARRKYQIVPPGFAEAAAAMLAGREEAYVAEGHPMREAVAQNRAARRQAERAARKQR